MLTTIAAVGSVSDVGRVRTSNEDAHIVDAEDGVFIVCDGMGGHAAGEIASGLATRRTHQMWTNPDTRARIAAYVKCADAANRRALFSAIRKGVMDAHLEIVASSQASAERAGMGTTFTGFLLAGGDAVFAHAGDSRAYLIRDGIALQLTEDHTLIARMHAAGVDLNEGNPSRWKGVITNALGIGDGTRVATFLVPLASGDRFALVSDGVSEYLKEVEVGDIVTAAPSPSLAARRLVELALERGGEDNATAVVVKVVEAGEVVRPVSQLAADEAASAACVLFDGLSSQERVRALRIAIEREVEEGDPERLPPIALGERVAYVVMSGSVSLYGKTLEPGALVYPESLITGSTPPDRESQATAALGARVLVIRRDDFFELTEDEPELGVKLYAVLATLAARMR